MIEIQSVCVIRLFVVIFILFVRFRVSSGVRILVLSVCEVIVFVRFNLQEQLVV